MAQSLSVLKIVQLTTDCTEIPMSRMRLTFAASVPAAEITVGDVGQAIKEGLPLPSSVRVALYYKDEEGEFVNLQNVEAVWPSCCISEGILKAWYICVPEAPATTPSTPGPLVASATIPSTPVRRCLGPHLHQPERKKIPTLDMAGYNGYSLLAAASDGCVSCVKYWLEKNVDPNFESSNERYTSLDCLFWAAKKGHVDPSTAEQLKEILKNAGGRANKPQ